MTPDEQDVTGPDRGNCTSSLEIPGLQQTQNSISEIFQVFVTFYLSDESRLQDQVYAAIQLCRRSAREKTQDNERDADLM